MTSETILLQVYSIGNVEAYSRRENSACHRQDFRVARAVEHFHDLCMVRSSKEVEPSEMVHRRPSELGDSLVRISPSGASESNWLHPIKVTTIKDSARGYHAMCFRSV